MASLPSLQVLSRVARLLYPRLKDLAALAEIGGKLFFGLFTLPREHFSRNSAVMTAGHLVSYLSPSPHSPKNFARCFGCPSSVAGLLFFDLPQPRQVAPFNGWRQGEALSFRFGAEGF